ncbi:MAG: hypothetical protein Q9223_004412 [Gallowayella weberi]
MPPTPINSYPALATSFTPPTQCGNSLSMMERSAYQIYYNEPVPVPGLTYTECYAPEFVTSYLKSLSGDILPPFSPLNCQDDYTTVYTSSIGTGLYIVCCPKGFSLHPPEVPIATRPGDGATCFSDISSTMVVYFDNSTLASSRTVINTRGTLQAYAHLMDGFAMVPSQPTAPRSTEAESTQAVGMPSKPAASTRVRASADAPESTSQWLQSTATYPTSSSSMTSISATAPESHGNILQEKTKHIIIGVVVGPVAGICLIIILVWRYKKKKHKSREPSADVEEPDKSRSGTSIVEPFDQGGSRTEHWVTQNQRSSINDFARS